VVKAKNCLELADRTNEVYAKEALKALAQRLNREARQSERRERENVDSTGTSLE
jgi:hypothetical protein